MRRSTSEKNNSLDIVRATAYQIAATRVSCRMCASFITASSTSIGGRQSQEDRIVVIPDLNVHVPQLSASTSEVDATSASPPPKRSFFGVFDGHGGQSCSDFLSKRFHLELAQSPLLASNPKAALLEVWDSMDGKFYQSCMQKQNAIRDSTRGAMANAAAATEPETATRPTTANQPANETTIGREPQEISALSEENSAAPVVISTVNSSHQNCQDREMKASFPVDGSTATVVLIVGAKMFLANCGDSAGILIHRDGSVKKLTADHGTLNQNEFQRVQHSGGFFREQTIPVNMGFPMCCLRRRAVVGKPRAYPGGLLITRAFGNFHSKVTALGGTPGVIIADCEEVLEMDVREDWGELVLASDGIWDVLPVAQMPQVLAQINGIGSRSFSAASPRANGTCERRSATTMEGRNEAGRAVEDSDYARRNLEQAYLNNKCARLVLSCIRHRHWEEHRAVADNASIIVLKFHAPSSPEVQLEREANGGSMVA